MCDLLCLACFGACAASLFIIAFYFFFGFIFICLAWSARFAVREHQGLISNDLSKFPNLCIIIGCLFTSLTILGWAGERKGRKTRIFYAFAQVAVICTGLYIYIDAYPNEANFEKHLLEGLNTTIQQYGVAGNTTDTKNVTADWDALQQNLECCGVRNYLDWQKSPYSKPGLPTPISCCREEHRMTGCSNYVAFDNPAESNKIIHVKGCLEEVRSKILGRMGILHYFLVPILISTFFGCLISCCSSGVRKDSEMTEKKVGPIIIRTRSKKSKDIEQPEEAEDGIPADVELQKLNPLPEDSEISGNKPEV